MIGRMTDTDVPAAETIPVTRGEKVAGWVALALLAVLGVFCFDLATGGRFLSGRLTATPPAASDGEPCEGCP